MNPIGFISWPLCYFMQKSHIPILLQGSNMDIIKMIERFI